MRIFEGSEEIVWILSVRESRR